MGGKSVRHLHSRLSSSTRVYQETTPANWSEQDLNQETKNAQSQET